MIETEFQLLQRQLGRPTQAVVPAQARIVDHDLALFEQPGQRPTLSAGIGIHLQPGDEQAAISLPPQGQLGRADLEAVEMRLQAQQG